MRGVSPHELFVGTKSKLLKHPQDDQRHVIVLFGAGGEGVGAVEDARERIGGAQPVARFKGFDQALFAPLLFAGIHRLTDAVGKR